MVLDVVVLMRDFARGSPTWGHVAKFEGEFEPERYTIVSCFPKPPKRKKFRLRSSAMALCRSDLTSVVGDLAAALSSPCAAHTRRKRFTFLTV